MKWNREAWTGLIWLRTGAGVGRLWMHFHKMRRISWLTFIGSANSGCKVPGRWFQKCGPRIAGDPWINVYNSYFEIYLSFYIKGKPCCLNTNRVTYLTGDVFLSCDLSVGLTLFYRRRRPLWRV
jgi:hypothetical protein